MGPLKTKALKTFGMNQNNANDSEPTKLVVLIHNLVIGKKKMQHNAYWL